MDRFSLGLIASLALVSLSGAAFAGEGNSRSLGVSAKVNDSCQINASAIVAGAGDGTTSGTVSEACNSTNGFQIFASYRELAPNEDILLRFAGDTKLLNRNGWSHVANRTGAKLGVRPVSVQYRGLRMPLTINLTITQL